MVDHDPAQIPGRRLFFTRETPIHDEVKWLGWAVRHTINVVVIPFHYEGGFFSKATGRVNRRVENLYERTNNCGFIIERGGWDLSSLLPRRYFAAKKECFRMVSGERRKDHHFCPTNPETIDVLKKRARLVFQNNPGTLLFHLWADRGHEKEWCACPACRAFTAEEQYMMAVNAAADVLGEMNPRAGITYIVDTGTWGGDIKPRANMVPLRNMPGTEEMPGWLLAEKGKEDINA